MIPAVRLAVPTALAAALTLVALARARAVSKAATGTHAASPAVHDASEPAISARRASIRGRTASEPDPSARTARAAPPARRSPKETPCFFARSRRIAALTTTTGHRVELYDGQISIDGRLDNRCNGLPGAHPLALAPWGDGFAVAFRDEPLHAWQEGRYRPLAGAPRVRVRALGGSTDTLYIGSDRGLWRLVRGERAHVMPAPLDALAVTALRTQPDGSLLVGTDGRGLWRVASNGRVTHVQRTGIVGCIRTRGSSAVALAPGPACLGDATVGRLPSDHVTALARYHGALAVGTFDGGVFLIDPGDRVTPLAGAPRHVNALIADGERLIIGAADGLFVAEHGRPMRVTLGTPEPHVNDVAKGRDGALWLATNRGLMRWTDGGVLVVGPKQGLPTSLVYSVTETADGALWVGTARGLARLEGRAVRVFDTAHGELPHDWVTALLPDGNAVYAGTYDSGVVRIDPSGTRTTPPAFRDVWVNPHGIARVGGALAVATEGDGVRSSALPESLTLPSRDVTALLEFGDSLWIGTRSGLMRRGH